MKLQTRFLLALVFALSLLFSAPAHAQQHRATRLGHPSTRFAPPLESPDDLRDRFRDPKLASDIAEILRQWGWKGDLADLHAAALTNEITEVKLPTGTRMIFMSSRENGRPICLRDVLWAGREPISAYVFFFSSQGRKYRCVTPRPCSNFFVEDLGPEPPRLELQKTAPAEASLCGPFELKLAVRNTGWSPVTQVRVTDTLPAGLRTADNQTTLNLDAGLLRPGELREFRVSLIAATPGSYVNQARVTSAEGATAEATASTLVQAPVLALDCTTPGEVLLGRPVKVCLTVRNTGSAIEPRTTVTLPVPAGVTLEGTPEGGAAADNRVTWEIADLAPGASRQVCANFATPLRTNTLAFAATARGSCAPAVETTCTTRVGGVSGILFEVVDTDDPVSVGDQDTYVLSVLNQGSLTLTNIRIACMLSAGQEFVSGSGPSTVRAEGRTVTIEPLATLAPQATAEWRVVIKATKVEDARFQADLQSDQFLRPITELESTQQY